MDGPAPAGKGSYVLVLVLAEDTRLTIGWLGTFEFPAGLYFYCGSALNGLEPRIRRHLRREKKRHWHIDHLTAVAPVLEVWWISDGERRECRWAKALADHGGEVVVRGFGSSDCRCPSHLLRWDVGAGVAVIRPLLPGNVDDNDVVVWKMGHEKDSPSLKLGESP